MVLVTKEQLEFKELLAGQKDRIQEQSKKQEDQLNQVCSLYVPSALSSFKYKKNELGRSFV